MVTFAFIPSPVMWVAVAIYAGIALTIVVSVVVYLARKDAHRKERRS